MKEQQSGHIINLASIGAYSVSPMAAVYCATKYAIRNITEGLRQEVGADIRVTLVSPGVTQSSSLRAFRIMRPGTHENGPS